MEAIPAIRNLVREGKTHMIGSIIQTGSKRGMTSLDQSLAQLVGEGRADEESARQKVNNLEEFDELVERFRQAAGGTGTPASN